MADRRIEELKALLPRCLLRDWVRLGARAARVVRDRHHATRHEALLDRLLDQARASIALRERRAAAVPLVSYPPELPISARKDDIIAAIRAHQVVVVAGETGSGKTTQIPKMCLEAGLGIEAKIGCTQPRRVAAVSLSQRIATELGVGWGKEVGCTIRFDDRSGPETYIKLMTDGILLAETQADPDLSEYNALVIDEAHERSLNIDFLLGHLRGLLARRRDLKLIITSATIDTAIFSQAFGGAPVIEVSGRLYPVEVRYAPLDQDSEELGDVTYVDAAVEMASRVAAEPGGGDVLVFMPGERDIRETSDLIAARLGAGAEIIPLYGRLSVFDQQRVFAPGSKRRIVVATNIAETSLTLPGIRYVIDAGLARISRYDARTRTKRLPVEPIAQSNANQRKGRAGRVRDGVCIRLYSEEDFSQRPAFMQPELQRANLAEVILRMQAFHLGEIETFPFLQPPSPAAIQAGYRLLQELGALDDALALTALGGDLARLPIDPTLGRMLLQSQREHAVRELLIIASGLSVQDPRERPLDQQEASAAAHRRFTDPRSDFLALLHLWNAFHDEWESLPTQNQRRRFCKAHFLSYLRMREWQDLHAQLHDALEELGTVRLNESSADYGAIHRSILSGLLGHVACHVARNQYQAFGNRPLALFPGSVLFDRSGRPAQRPSKADRATPAPEPRSSQPAWIVAGEIVETSQRFARTLAGIDPEWIADLARHLCKVTHTEPHWDVDAGRVLATEVTTLNGLEVRRRKVAFGNIDLKQATAIFIRSALVEEQLVTANEESDSPAVRAPSPTSPLRGRRGSFEPPTQRAPVAEPAFLTHNRRVRERVEEWQTRLRRHEFGDLDEALFQYYARHVAGVSSRDELNRALRGWNRPQALCVEETDLTGGRALDLDRDAFPDGVAVGGQSVPVVYAYAPGEEWDGVTLQVPAELARVVNASGVEWSVPALRLEQVNELLGFLPKALRRELQPFAPKVAEIVRDLQTAGPTLAHDLSRFVRARYGVEVPVNAWRPEALPAHLRVRIEVLGGDGKSVATGRDLEAVRRMLVHRTWEAPTLSDAWAKESARWERVSLTGWTFGDLPERIQFPEAVGTVSEAWPGLRVEDGAVCVRLFRSPELARRESLAGVRALLERALEKDLGWLQRDLRALARFGPIYAPLGPVEELQETAFENLKRHALRERGLPALTAAHFAREVEETRERLRGLAMPLIDRVEAILQTLLQVRQKIGKSDSPVASAVGSRPGVLKDLSQLGQLGQLGQPRAGQGVHPLSDELARLVPPRFLETIPFERLVHLPRYLKALLIRAERRDLAPAKDTERARQLGSYVEALGRCEEVKIVSEEGRAMREELRWMIEEYRVSLFAQELGTAFPVSPKRLDELLRRLRAEGV